LLALRKKIIQTDVYVIYPMQFDVFFPTNPGNTSAEICEKQQGKKSAKNLCLALAAKEGGKHCTYPIHHPG
jgi:hypothetical protein